MEYKIIYTAKRDGVKTEGSRHVNAPNQGTAEDRVIRQLKREHFKNIVIEGVQETS